VVKNSILGFSGRNEELIESIPTPKAHWWSQQLSILFALESLPSAMDMGWGE